MRTTGRLLIAATAATVTLAAAPLSPAAASTPTTPGATSSSVAVFTGSAALSAGDTVGGPLGGLFDALLGQVISQDLNPLVSALQSLSYNSVIGGTLGVGGPYTAGTPTQQAAPGPGAFPSDTVPPSPCGASYGLPCYSANPSAPSLGSLASMSIGSVAGYTQQVASTSDATTPMFGRARVSNTSVTGLPTISALPNPIVGASTSTIDGKANCPTSGAAPTALDSSGSVSILNGLITLTVSPSTGQVANLVVNGVGYTSLSGLPVVTVGSTTVQQYGSAVKATVALTASQLINGLGLQSNTVTDLVSNTVGSSLAVTVIVGPHAQVTSSTATTWGLGIGVDLSGSMGFSFNGAVNATVAVPTGIGAGNNGNVMDLRLGYATCTTGAGTTSSLPIPPALI